MARTCEHENKSPRFVEGVEYFDQLIGGYKVLEIDFHT
jgi:hypothetical protein